MTQGEKIYLILKKIIKRNKMFKECPTFFKKKLTNLFKFSPSCASKNAQNFPTIQHKNSSSTFTVCVEG